MRSPGIGIHTSPVQCWLSRGKPAGGLSRGMSLGEKEDASAKTGKIFLDAH